MARLLYPDQTTEPFTITAVYPELGGEAGRAARELQAAAIEHEAEEGHGDDGTTVQRTTFSLEQIEEFHELYHLVEDAIGGDRLDVLLNGREVPLTRELWLPLLWTLRP